MATLYFAAYPSATTPTWDRSTGWSGTPTMTGTQASAPAAPQAIYEPTISWTGSLVEDQTYKMWVIWDDGIESSNSGVPFGSTQFTAGGLLTSSGASSTATADLTTGIALAAVAEVVSTPVGTLYNPPSTVAFDNATEYVNSSGTHTPLYPVRGVLIFLAQTGSSGASIGVPGAATYGGVDVPLVATVEAADGVSDSTRFSVYFLSSGVIPQGTQTITNTFGVVRCMTLVCDRNLEVVDYVAYSHDATGPENPVGGTLELGGRSSYVAMGVASGLHNTGLVSPQTGWSTVSAYDRGDEVVEFYERTDNFGTTDIAVGVNQAATYACSFIGVAVAAEAGFRSNVTSIASATATLYTPPTVTLSNLEAFDITATSFKLRLDYDFA